jgi:hypothetical protein
VAQARAQQLAQVRQLAVELAQQAVVARAQAQQLA